MTFTFSPMNEDQARTVLNWRYEPPYDLYNLDVGDAEPYLQDFLDPQNGYHVICDEQGVFLAFCCFGPDAWVPGGDYSAEALDIGMGLRPDLTGRGQGLRYAQAVLGFAADRFTPAVFRVTVAQFNKRALRVWEKAGFQPVQVFQKIESENLFEILTCKL